MKNLRFFLVMMLVCLTTGLSAQTIRNANNSQVGKIESDGTVRNASNSRIGKIESDGTVRNANNSRIGKIESDGTVRDANNSRMGSASGVNKKYAAAFFFFDFF